MKAVHSFIRYTPKELLKECCEQCAPDIATAHDWQSGNSKKTAEALTEAFANSSREQYAAFKQTAERVTEMTDSLGQAALQACVRNFDAFRSLANAYARATWAFLHEPTAFRRAEEIHYLDYRRQGRMWDSCWIFPCCRMPTTMQAFIWRWTGRKTAAGAVRRCIVRPTPPITAFWPAILLPP